MGARWYVLALLTAPVLMTVALLALSLTSPAFLPGIFTSEDRTTLLLVGLAVGLGAGLVEELGWTGFAVPELRRRHGVLSSLLVAMLMHLSFTASLLILNPLAISGVALVTYSFALAAAVWIVVAAVVVANGGWPGSLPGGSRIRAA
jgi:membrane protease YdiL (CAAX protease family)